MVVQYYCHYYHTTTRAGGAIGALLRPLPMGHDPLHLHHRPVLGARNYRKGARDHPMLRPRLQGVCALQPYDERLQPYDERLQPQRTVDARGLESAHDATLDTRSFRARAEAVSLLRSLLMGGCRVGARICTE